MKEIKKLKLFFKYDLEVKKILNDIIPLEQYAHSNDTIIKYNDLLFKALKSFRFYFGKMIQLVNYDNKERFSLNNLLGDIEQKLVQCEMNFYAMSSFYNENFAGMRKELVDEVRENCIGYTINRSVSLGKAKSINELLHIIHQTVINNENIYQQNLLEQKTNDEGYPISLYGEYNLMAKNIFDNYPKDMLCGKTDILALNDLILLMIRDRGHALSIEIEKVNNKYFVNYFIPKICNIDMVNNLKGIRKVTVESKYATGVLACSEEELIGSLIDLISHVPMDNDIPKTINNAV